MELRLSQIQSSVDILLSGRGFTRCPESANVCCEGMFDDEIAPRQPQVHLKLCKMEKKRGSGAEKKSEKNFWRSGGGCPAVGQKNGKIWKTCKKHIKNTEMIKMKMCEYDINPDLLDVSQSILKDRGDPQW